MHERLIVKIREKHPGLARRRDEGSPMAAIRLFCLECMGGSPNDVKGCQTVECSLHRLRFGHRPKGGAT